MTQDNNPLDSSIEFVEILQTPQNTLNQWQPIIGSETLDLIANFDIPMPEKQRIQNEALSILSKCIAPTVNDQQLTGLVIGYVQSGKTMSFTTLASLARDNNYQIIIVIAGTSLPLLDQSTRRLDNDLRLSIRDDRQWQFFESNKVNTTSKRNIIDSMRNTLVTWKDPSVKKSLKKTILITVMKHHKHLRAIRDILKNLDLRGVPTIIIDDEADQASLNARINQGKMSSTYYQILQLKDVVPHHTFLQYTATPQAPLLINLIDTLSPRFAQVLTPGNSYTGGKEFFTGNSKLVRIIPDGDIPPEDEKLLSPPQSLWNALFIYFLGVASGLDKEEKGNRSMLVHPSHKTISHEDFYRCIQKIIKNWQTILQSNDNDLDKNDLLVEFKNAYKDLSQTVEDLPSFETLWNILPLAIRETQLLEVNAKAGKTPPVNWKNTYAHILVGGQAMDRGFTVEGLTVTYMPRGVGSGNVDTIQQRARFFGYKKGYLGYCRIFLESKVASAYINSIEHEESVRNEIEEFSRSNEPLTQWKRAFFLDKKLQPTRRSIIDIGYIRGNFSTQWFEPKVPHYLEEATRENLQVYNAFRNLYIFEVNQGDPRRTQDQKHLVANDIPLSEVYQELLTRFRIAELSDSQKFTGLLLQIKMFLDKNQDPKTTIYLMSGGRPRERTTTDNEIPNLFQGSNANTGYPGDRAIVAQEGLTVQIHILNVVDDDKIYTNVPAIVVKVPKEMSVDWLVQNQGG